jgi:hypothetical protein
VPATGAQPQPGRLEVLDSAGAVVGPHDVGEHGEDAGQVAPVRGDQPGGQQVQAKVGVRDISGRGVEVDLGPDDALARPPVRIDASSAARSAGTAWGRRRRGCTERRSGYQVSSTAPPSVIVASP